jgi:hypothetical protein
MYRSLLGQERKKTVAEISEAPRLAVTGTSTKNIQKADPAATYTEHQIAGLLSI